MQQKRQVKSISEAASPRRRHSSSAISASIRNKMQAVVANLETKAWFQVKHAPTHVLRDDPWLQRRECHCATWVTRELQTMPLFLTFVPAVCVLFPVNHQFIDLRCLQICIFGFFSCGFWRVSRKTKLPFERVLSTGSWQMKSDRTRGFYWNVFLESGVIENDLRKVYFFRR